VSLVAGIDVSSHAIDIVYLDENGETPPRWQHHPLTGPDAWERARGVRDTLPWRGGGHWSNVLAAGIERPFGPSSGVLNIVVGGVLASLPTRLLVAPWTPGQWKKQVGLKGNANKLEVAAFASVESGAFTLYDHGQDCLDAYCIALATLQTIERTAAA
jgi:hypothetical protein